jgi:hypothetical protein
VAKISRADELWADTRKWCLYPTTLLHYVAASTHVLPHQCVANDSFSLDICAEPRPMVSGLCNAD